MRFIKEYSNYLRKTLDENKHGFNEHKIHCAKKQIDRIENLYNNSLISPCECMDMLVNHLFDMEKWEEV